MKEKIIIPVDLTPASKKAFILAVKIAEIYDFEIEIIPMIRIESFVMNTIRQDFYGHKKMGRSDVISNFLIAGLIENEMPTPDFAIKIDMAPGKYFFSKKKYLRNDVVMVLFGLENNNRYEVNVSKDIALQLAEKMGCRFFNVSNYKPLNKRKNFRVNGKAIFESSDLINIFLEERNKNGQK